MINIAANDKATEEGDLSQETKTGATDIGDELTYVSPVPQTYCEIDENQD